MFYPVEVLNSNGYASLTYHRQSRQKRTALPSNPEFNEKRELKFEKKLRQLELVDCEGIE